MKRLGFFCLLLFVLISPLAAQDIFRITEIAWSPDGTLLAVGTTDGVIVYDVAADLQPIVWSVDTEYPILSVQFSPSGEWLAAGTGDYSLQAGYIYIWNTNSGEQITSFEANTFAIYALAFSPDGSRLVTGGGYSTSRHGGDYRIRVWDTATWEALPHYQHDGFGVVSDVAFNPDGTLLTYSHDYTPITVIDVARNRAVASIHETSARTIIFTQDGNRLLLCFSNRVETWELRYEPEFHLVRQAQWLSPLMENYRPIHAVIACTEDHFATSTEGGLLQIHNMATGDVLVSHTIEMSFASTAAFSPDGRRLAFIGETRIAPGSWETTYEVMIWTLNAP